MTTSRSFEIRNYSFNYDIKDDISNLKFAKDLWPIVYIISHDEENIAYIGETTDVISRLTAHQKSPVKSRLTAVHLIESERFNKSATLDIEANLIKYFAGDGKYKLLNGNLGIANHSYYQKLEYWELFTSIWDELRSRGITQNSLETIDNSDLFKYSPYKSLSATQQKGIIMIIDSLMGTTSQSIIIKGGAGSGKTVMAVYLLKLLVTNLEDFNYSDLGKDENGELFEKVYTLKEKFKNPKIALVVPMSSFRNTLKKVFSNIKGLKRSMVISPSEMSKDKYDLVIVDEAHRLKRRKNLTGYAAFDANNKRLGLKKEDGNELDWVNIQSKTAVYFYDNEQSVKPTDILPESFRKVMLADESNVLQLTSQFRVKSGNDYVYFLNGLLNKDGQSPAYFEQDNYDLKLFTEFEPFVTEIKQKDGEYGLSRMIAGFAWPWISKKHPELYDITIEGIDLKWNMEPDDWINSEGSVNEVGCIHTTQGYDLNYAGIIFGWEIKYDPEKKEIYIQKENYCDNKGKAGVRDPLILQDYIINIYKTIMLRGIKGTYVYVCDPELRKYMSQYMPVVTYTRHVEESISEDIALVPYLNSVPFYDLKIAAGSFSKNQIEEGHELVKVPDGIRITQDMFACKVIGESMNRIIPNGSTCLFKRYEGGSRNGLIVLCESSEFQDTEMGSGYTVKEYSSKKIKSDSGWEHQSIILSPLSNDNSYRDIILEAESMATFKIIGIFDRVLEHVTGI